jgi:hypothetical protein
VVADGGQLGEEVGRHLLDLEAEEVLELGQRDHDGDAVGEADHDRHRHEAHHLAEPEQAHRHEQDACHHGAMP